MRQNLLSTKRPKYMSWAGNFNWHHSQWDKNRKKHLFIHENPTKAQIVIDLQIKYNMNKLLPKGIPTLIATNTGNHTRPDNIFVSKRLENQVLTCMTTPELRLAKAYHIPIKTIIKASIPTMQPKPRQNYSKTNWLKIKWKLKYWLQKTTPPTKIVEKQELITCLEILTNMILETVKEHLPLMKPYPNRKR